MSELDDLVGEDEAPEAVAEPEVEAEEAAAPEETTAEAAPSTGENEGAPPAPKADPVPAHVPVPALLDERAKRQAAESEAKELRAQLAERDAPAAPDPTEDPAGAFAHLQQSFDQKLTQLNIKQSRMLVMGQKEDFAAREQEFMTLANDNPSLVDEMLQADNPALYAYDTAVRHEELAALKDVDGYKAKLRAEVEAEVRADLAKQGEAAATETAASAKAAGIPSLATATGSGSGSALPSDDDLSSIVAGHST